MRLKARPEFSRPVRLWRLRDRESSRKPFSFAPGIGTRETGLSPRR
jgi:hypothetical protein